MKKIIPILVILITFINLYKPKTEDVIIPANSSIRLRIIPADNSANALVDKAKVKDLVKKEIIPLLSTEKTLDSTRTKITNSLPLIKEKLNTLNIPYSLNYGENYFPTKTILNQTYNSGEYESLVITLGKGEGSNYWCVLYPPLCLIDEDKYGTDTVEYKSIVKEIIDKYLK